MTTIALRFPGGRYHATPWNSHVNEGLVEWPPGPWRLLRALLATGFTRLGWADVPDDGRSLLETLSSVLPSYRLPRVIIAHTRHYMPVIEGRKQTTTKVIDAFARLDRSSELLIHYPLELTDSETRLLASLLDNLGYLGRAESWVDSRLVNDIVPDDNWCAPLDAFASSEPGGDSVRMIAPITAASYAEWREREVADALARVEAAAPRGRRVTAAQRRNAVAPYPANLLECLLIGTHSLRQYGWTQPPGSRTILYRRMPDTVGRRAGRPRHPRTHQVEAALLSLSSDTKRGDVLPLFTCCLPQAELLHQAIVSKLGEEAPRSPALSGRDPITRRPLRGHRHAHYIPLDLDADGRLDHVIVHAPMRLDARAQTAIRKVARTWTKGDDRAIIVTCVGFGSLDEFAKQLRRRDGSPVAPLETARSWVSLTPFIPPRHLKRRRHTLEDQVRAELEGRGFPAPATVEKLGRDELVQRGLLRFVRARRENKPQPPARCAFGIRLAFDEPVRGPIALGYGSHFGLGLFVPA